MERSSNDTKNYLKFIKTNFPNATKEDVKNKFNSLRANFKKELKKIKDLKKSGTVMEEMYESAWG